MSKEDSGEETRFTAEFAAVYLIMSFIHDGEASAEYEKALNKIATDKTDGFAAGVETAFDFLLTLCNEPNPAEPPFVDEAITADVIATVKRQYITKRDNPDPP